MTKTQIENKYGVKVANDSYVSFSGRTIKQYRMYSADGCQWENGLRTIKDVERECKRWEKQLLSIKDKANK